MGDVCHPIAYPIALPDPARMGVAVRFSCDSSRWVGSAAVPIKRPRVRLWASEALVARWVEADHLPLWRGESA
jgi:hypothetical protein